MPQIGVNPQLVEIALDRVNGSTFEQFVNHFYPSIAGEKFVPLGGMHDGGADAFEDERLMVGEQTGTIYQSSVQKNFQAKIAATVRRLRSSGRNPDVLVYVTSQKVPQIDFEETKLSEEHKLSVRIRYRAFLTAHVNDSVGTRAAFDSFLRPELSFLQNVGAADVLPTIKGFAAPAVYVFLRQELDRSDQKVSLVNALADGLILWALEGTDPDRRIFMTQKQVLEKIGHTVPAAARILKGAIPARLVALATGKARGVRPIRWHRKQDLYCLAHEFRSRLEEDNAADEALKIAVLNIFRTRITTENATIDPDLAGKAAEVSLRAVQKTFELEGLQFAAFLGGSLKESILPTIGEHVDLCLDEARIPPSKKAELKVAVISNLQSAFYHSHEAERLFFTRLSSTFTLLFCLNTEPHVVEYFQQMAGDFYLYVGSDLLVRALSERYLRTEDQATRNALRLIREAGGTLVLAEPVLDEIHTHIRATDREYNNKYKLLEPHKDTEFIFRNSDRVLIRAYFYAKCSPPEGIEGPRNWAEYIEQFCNFRDLHTSSGREQFRNYLTAQFGLLYESGEDIKELAKDSEVKELAQRLLEYKGVYAKARDDALLTLAVYGRRRKRRESSRSSPYGYRTWWLTGESQILNYTRELTKKEGSQFIMRPDFIVRFLAIAPSAADIRRSFQGIFPSLLGIRLARRVAPEELARVLEKVGEAARMEDGRRVAKISDLSDQLKTRFYAAATSTRT